VVWEDGGREAPSYPIPVKPCPRRSIQYRDRGSGSGPVAEKGVLMSKSMFPAVLVVLLFLAPAAAPAQDTAKAEVFGGYSYLRADPSDMSLHGWNAAATVNISEWFGITGDFSGHYGSPSVRGFEIPYLDVNSHTFMVGPKVTWRAETVAPFAHFLIGASRVSTSAFGYGDSATALAAAIGGGLDVRLTPSLSLRAVQVDYLMTRHDAGPQIFFSGIDDRQDNLRISAGLVFHFGD